MKKKKANNDVSFLLAEKIKGQFLLTPDDSLVLFAGGDVIYQPLTRFFAFLLCTVESRLTETLILEKSLIRKTHYRERRDEFSWFILRTFELEGNSVFSYGTQWLRVLQQFQVTRDRIVFNSDL